MAGLENKIKIIVEAEVKKAQADLERIGEKGKKAGKGVQKGFSAAKATIAGFAAILGGSALAALGSFIKKAGEFEQIRVAFKTFLGDAKQADKVLARLEKFSIVTPFTIDQVNQAGKALLAFGISADELEPKLSQIGDLSAGTGKDFNELAVIFGKARVQGTLFAEDINQLTEAGIPIIDEFAKILKVPTSEIKKLGSQGKITFDLLEQAFENMTTGSGKFAGLIDEQSKTFLGRISTLQGNLSLLARGIGQELIPMLDGLVDITNEFLGSESGMKNLNKAIVVLVQSFRLLAKGIVLPFKLIFSGINAVNEAMGNFQKIMKAIVTGSLKDFKKAAITSFDDILKSAKDAAMDIADVWVDPISTAIDKFKELDTEAGKSMDNISAKAAKTGESLKLLTPSERERVDKFIGASENRISQIEKEKGELLAIEGLSSEQIGDIEMAASLRTSQTRAQAAQSAIQTTQGLISQTQDIFNMAHQNRLMLIQNEISALEDQRDRGIISEEEFARKKEQLNKKERQEKKKAAKANKASSIVGAIINGALAITGLWAGLASLGIPGIVLAAVMTAVVAGVTAAQVGVISSQPIPAFQRGTTSSPGGSALVGEAGPEIVNLPQGSEVIPSDRIGGSPFSAGNPNSVINTTENVDNKQISITVMSSDPLEFANKLKREYGVDILGA